MSLVQRFRDWRHERRIKRHVDACKSCMAAGDSAKARIHWDAFLAAQAQRSADQIRRMERRMGIL